MKGCLPYPEQNRKVCEALKRMTGKDECFKALERVERCEMEFEDFIKELKKHYSWEEVEKALKEIE